MRKIFFILFGIALFTVGCTSSSEFYLDNRSDYDLTVEYEPVFGENNETVEKAVSNGTKALLTDCTLLESNGPMPVHAFYGLSF